jgi:hypothetical protein
VPVVPSFDLVIRSPPRIVLLWIACLHVSPLRIPPCLGYLILPELAPRYGCLV